MQLARSLPTTWVLPQLRTRHVVLGAFILAVSRLPESLFRAEFWADDGWLYTQALDMGPASIVDPYGGYLLLGQRAVIYVETLLPAYWAPLLGNLVALAVFVGAAAFAASDRMPWSRRTGTVIALGIVALPAADPIIGTLSHVQWSVALWIALVALSRPATGRWESVGLGLAGLTGIGSMIFWPLFLRQPRRLLIVGATAIVQVILYLFIADRYTAEPVDWALVPQAVMVRVFATPLIGPVASGLTAMLVGALASTPTTMMLDPALAGRYFFLAGAAFVVLIVTRWPRSLPLAGILLAGIVLSWRVESPGDMDWDERSACIGGSAACTVPVEPEPKWDVVWRGE
jgi:hypothetical protein